MTDTEAGLRQPSTTWEYAVSAADQLVRWHEHPAASPEPLRTELVVLLAAAVHAHAADAGLDGPDVVHVPLTALMGYQAAAVLERCPAPPGAGGEERARLLQQPPAYLETVRLAANDAVWAHLSHTATAGGPVPTIGDRRPALQRAAMLRAAADAFGQEAL